MAGTGQMFIFAVVVAIESSGTVQAASAFTGGTTAPACAACVLDWCSTSIYSCSTWCAPSVGGFPVCMGACVAAWCAPCAIACACFEPDAGVMKLGGNVAKAFEIVEGDFVATLDNQMLQTRFTKVVSARTPRGTFEALNISIGAVSLVVTPAHQLYIHGAGTLGSYKQAADLSVGDRVWLLEGSGQISSIAQTNISGKTDIITESCSMLVNGVLVATCDLGVSPEKIAQLLV